MVFRSKFHSKTHSSYPQILRPPPLAAANRQPLAFNRLEAFVGCKVKTHVKAITAAAKKIYKKPFGSALSPQYMYVNTRGTTLIQSIHEMRKDLAGMKKSIKESMEKAKKAEEKAKKAGEKAKEGESRIVGLETKQAETEEWVATMQPLQETAIDIRKRFFAHYENLIGQPSAVGADTVRQGSKAAHEGNLRTDIVLFRRGDITNAWAFRKLYGIRDSSAERYLKSEKIVKIINARATSIANSAWSGRKWDEVQEREFLKTLSDFVKTLEESAKNQLRQPDQQAGEIEKPLPADQDSARKGNDQE